MCFLGAEAGGRGGGAGNGKFLFSRHGVLVGLDERVLEMGKQQYPIGYATIRSC